MKKYFRVDYILKDLPEFTQKDVINRLKQFPNIFREVIDVFDDNVDGKGYERLSIYPMYDSKKLVDNFMNKRREELNQINKIMEENARNPLFENTEKVKASWKFRDYLMEFLSEIELNKEFNCMSYNEYHPFVTNKKHTVVQEDENTNTPC